MYIIEEKKFKNIGYVEARHESITEGEKCAALLFIHGAGSRGSDLTILKTSSALVNAEKHDVRLRIFEPQCQASCWFEIFEQLEEFAEYVATRKDVDSSRLYLAGVSMGGYAAWQLGITRHKLFAALTPICGGGMYWMADYLVGLPIWAFHGALDRTVYVSESINMVNAVKSRGGSARLTIFPDAEHNAWDPTFESTEYWDWLMSKEKNKQ